MGNPRIVLLFFVEHAQPLHAREGVLLSGRQGVPRSVMEGQQGRGKDQGQDEWVPRDLEPRSWQVGGVGIAVLQQIVHGRKFLPFLHHWCFRSGGGFVVFGGMILRQKLCKIWVAPILGLNSYGKTQMQKFNAQN
jgi:hypothetical protein